MPPCLQIVTILKSRIAGGALRPGDIPAFEQGLCAAFDASPITARRARQLRRGAGIRQHAGPAGDRRGAGSGPGAPGAANPTGPRAERLRRLNDQIMSHLAINAPHAVDVAVSGKIASFAADNLDAISKAAGSPAKTAMIVHEASLLGSRAACASGGSRRRGCPTPARCYSPATRRRRWPTPWSAPGPPTNRR